MATNLNCVTADIPCNVCGNRQADVLATEGRDGEALRTLICRQCGLVWSDPFPMDVREYYQKDYRLSYKGTYAPKMKHILRAANVALSRLNKIRSYLPGRVRLLDVGSGGGEFLYLMQSLGLSAQGIEPNEGYGEYSKMEYGLNVNIGFAQNHDFSAGTFDIVTMWHVLEHTDNPVSVLNKIRGWLRENGVLIVEVPNVEAVCQMPKSTFHAAHLFNFNHVTLECVANKSGFKTIAKLTSEDGGNITQFLQVSPGIETKNCDDLVENYRKVSGIYKAHTNLAHYLSAHPYQRLLRKLTQLGKEKKLASGYVRGKALLDSKFAGERPLTVG